MKEVRFLAMIGLILMDFRKIVYLWKAVQKRKMQDEDEEAHSEPSQTSRMEPLS